MKLVFFTFLLCFFQTSKAQYLDCHNKQVTLSFQNNTFKTNAIQTPLKIKWLKNSQIIKENYNYYTNNNTRLFYNSFNILPVDTNFKHPFEHTDNISLYAKNTPFFFTNNKLVYGDPNYVDFAIFYYGSPNIYKCKLWQTEIGGIASIIDTFIQFIGDTNQYKDSFINCPLQYYINPTNNFLYILDENPTYSLTSYYYDSLYYFQPKIIEYDLTNKKYIRNLPQIKTFEKRNWNQNRKRIRFTNMSFSNNKLYLSYRYYSRDTLAIFDFNTNAWVQEIGLNKTYTIPDIYDFTNAGDQILLGKSRVWTSDKGIVYIFEYLGDIYKFNADFTKRDTLFHFKDTNMVNFYSVNFNTRSVFADGLENLYIGDIKDGFIKRFRSDLRQFEVIVDTIKLGCYYNQLPYHLERYMCNNLQLDCSGNIYAEYVPMFKPASSSYCFTSYHIKLDAKIDDTLQIMPKCGDRYEVITYFMDSDSVINRYEFPRTFVTKNIDTIACYSFFLHNKTYTQSGFYKDTLVSSSCFDTIYHINLKIATNTFDTFKVEICNSYKFGDSTFSKTGLYTQKFKSVNGCDSFVTLHLISKEVSGKVKLENGVNYTAQTPNAEYQWYHCHPWRKIINEKNQTFTTYSKGSYAVVVNSLDCIDTSDCIELYSSGIINSHFDNDIFIYPNPTKDLINIEFFDFQKEVHYTLTDILGKEVVSKSLKNINTFQLDLKPFSKGVYMLQIDKFNQQIKIIKE